MTALNNSAFADNASDLFQHKLQSTFQRNLVIAESVSAPDPLSLYDRLMAVKPMGLSKHAWTVRAGVSPAVFTDIQRRGNAKHDTVEKLLEAIGITWAEFEAGQRQAEKEPSSPEVRAAYLSLRGQQRPRDVPIVGTAECADLEFSADNVSVMVETIELHFDDIVDFARRPLSLDNRRDVYAIYFRGDSMAPRYEPGELGYVDPRRPPSMRDYVVVQLRRPDEAAGEHVHRVLAKRLVRVSATFVELEQFNPPATFRVDRKDIKHIHRIIPFDELVSF